MKIFWVVFKKSVFLLFVRSGFFFSAFIFGLGLWVLFRFTLPLDSLSKEVAIAFFWTGFFIVSLYLCASSQEWEWENYAYRLVRVYRQSLSYYFWGRIIAVFLSLFTAYFGLGLLWSVFYAAPFAPFLGPFWNPAQGPAFLTTGLLVSLSMAFVGELASVMAIHSRFKHITLFIILMPLGIPLFLTAATISRAVANQKPWMGLLPELMAFLLIFAGASYWLYEFLLEE